jgi:osmotically-inducible protein OsmY
MNMKHTHSIGLAVLLSLGLSACAPIMIAGFAGSALVASDRRTSGAQLEDETIEMTPRQHHQLQPPGALKRRGGFRP